VALAVRLATPSATSDSGYPLGWESVAGSPSRTELLTCLSSGELTAAIAPFVAHHNAERYH